MTAAQCVELGYDEIQHINFLVLNFFPDVKDTNTIARLTKPGELAAGLDLTSPPVQSFIKLLLEPPHEAGSDAEHLRRPVHGRASVKSRPAFKAWQTVCPRRSAETS